MLQIVIIYTYSCTFFFVLGYNCLHIAVVKNSVKLVAHLMKLGADLNAKEYLSGKTALHLAVEWGHLLVLNILLEKCKPYINALTYAGVTAYQIACYKDSNLAKELAHHGAYGMPKSESAYSEYDCDDDDDSNDDNDSDDDDGDDDDNRKCFVTGDVVYH